MGRRAWILLFVLLFAGALAEEPPTSPAQPPFTDVTPKDPEWLAVLKLAQENLLYGRPDGRFDGSAPITRRELALLLYRLWKRLKEEGQDVLAAQVKDLAVRLSAVERRLAALGALKGEALEEEIAGLKAAIEALQEQSSALLGEIGRLKEEHKRLAANLAEVNQRTLAWNEDAVALTERLDRLEKALKELGPRLKGELDAALQEVRQEVQALKGQLNQQAGHLSELEGRITKVNEEVFGLGDKLQKRTRALETAIEQLTHRPPPLQLEAGITRLQPLRLFAAVGHDAVLFGLGAKARAEYQFGSPDALIEGLAYLPLFSGNANAQLGLGFAYHLSGPWTGTADMVAGLDLAAEAIRGFEIALGGRFHYPSDGSTPYSTLGASLRLRLK